MIHPPLRGAATPGRTVGPSYSQAVGTVFLCACCTSLNFLAFILPFFFPSSCFFALFQSYSSHAQISGENSCMSYTFFIAILNETCFFRSLGIDFVFIGECYKIKYCSNNDDNNNNKNNINNCVIDVILYFLHRR